jgi:hypothetical protein
VIYNCITQNKEEEGAGLPPVLEKLGFSSL